VSTTMAPIHIRHKEGFHDQRIGTTFSAVLRLVGNICCNDGGIERHARPLDIRAFTPSTLVSELSRLYRGASHNIGASKPFFDLFRNRGHCVTRATACYSTIRVWFSLCFRCQFNEPPNRFCAGREVDLGAPPVVYHPQELLRYSHLKHAILRPFCGAARGPLALCHFMGFVLTKRICSV
jgi:hypothetical protein